MSRHLAPIALTLAGASLNFASCNVQPKAEIAAFGDSVTWGYGDLPGGWVRHLEQESGYAISNLGVPGEHTDAAAGRIDAAMRSAPLAKVVFVLHGGNDWVHDFRTDDCQRDCPPEEIDSKYEEVADHLRTVRAGIAHRGKQAVFLTYWPDSNDKCPQYTPEIFAHYQEHRQYLNAKIIGVAAEHGDQVVHLENLENFGSASDFFDCLHPSARGYRKIAQRILLDIGEWAPADPAPSDLWKNHLRW